MIPESTNKKSAPRDATKGLHRLRPILIISQASIPLAASRDLYSGPDYLLGGKITESMTWITPFDASMSVVTILAPST